MPMMLYFWSLDQFNGSSESLVAVGTSSLSVASTGSWYMSASSGERLCAGPSAAMGFFSVLSTSEDIVVVTGDVERIE